MLPMPTLNCPYCQATINRSQFKTRPPWKCPGCSRLLQFSRTYSGTCALISLGVSMAFSYGLGLRGWFLPVLGFVLWFPAALIFTFPFSWAVRPRLQGYGNEAHFTSLFPN